MGWQDRDYASEYHPPGRASVVYGRGMGRPRSVVTTLIIANVAVYVLCAMTGGSRGGVFESPIFQFGAMTSEHVARGQVWRLITSDYLHWNTMHILMNMIGLHFLGRPLERIWGPRKFFGVYTVAGILGSVFYMLLTMLHVLPLGVAAGASGCVLGLLGAAAVMFPHAEVYVYFLFPVKIRVVAVVLGGWYILNVLQGGRNAGGDACHLAGLAFGVWWVMKGELWWTGRQRRGRAKPARRSDFKAGVQQRKVDAELIDRILTKVHDAGVTSLSDRERRALAEATERQRQEEHRFDRMGGA